MSVCVWERRPPDGNILFPGRGGWAGLPVWGGVWSAQKVDRATRAHRGPYGHVGPKLPLPAGPYSLTSALMGPIMFLGPPPKKGKLWSGVALANSPGPWKALKGYKKGGVILSRICLKTVVDN